MPGYVDPFVLFDRGRGAHGALVRRRGRRHDARGSVVQVAAGFVAGVVLVAWLDRVLPHWHARFAEGRRGDDHARYTDADDAALPQRTERARQALLLSGAISLHNFPEGLAVALPMRSMGMGLRRTTFWTSMTGLVEIAGALLAYAVGTAVEGFLPWGLAFAAGAMLYVVIDEMVPAAHTRGEQRASLVFLAAFLAMTAVIELLGGFIAQG